MITSPVRLAALIIVAMAVQACDISPEATGSCQPPTAVGVGSSVTLEAFHNDCAGPDTPGDVLVMSLTSQERVRFTMTPDGFRPSLALYKGVYGDANPEQVFWVVGNTTGQIHARVDLAPGPYFAIASSRNAVRGAYTVTIPSSTLNDCLRDNWTTVGITVHDSLTLADCERASSFWDQRHTIWVKANDSVSVELAVSDSVDVLIEEACCFFAPKHFRQLAPNDTVNLGFRSASFRPYSIIIRRDVELDGPVGYRLRIF